MTRINELLSDKPPERIMGTECEYDFQELPGKGSSLLLSEEALYRSFNRQAEIPLRYFVGGFKRALQNGATIYPDCGHIEYNSSETRGAVDAVAADFAGVNIIRHVARTHRSEHNGVYRRTGSQVIQPDNMDALGRPIIGSRTSGYHENFSTISSAVPHIIESGMLPTTLAARVWAWSGKVTMDGYQLSQKIDGIGGTPINTVQHQRRTGEGGKPMATIMTGGQDQDINPSPEVTRVEVRFADAGLSARARVMSLGITSLALTLSEHQKKLTKTDRAWVLADPLKAARMIALDMDFTRTFLTRNGKHLSMIDVNEMIAKSGKRLGEKIELTKTEQLSIDLLLDTVDRLRRCDPKHFDYSPVIGFMDNMAKYHVMHNLKNITDLSSTNPKAVAFDLQWDRIYPKGASQVWWERFGIDSDLVPQQRIDELTIDPPSDTRASFRGRLISAGLLLEHSFGNVLTHDFKRIELGNPYASYDDSTS